MRIRTLGEMIGVALATLLGTSPGLAQNAPPGGTAPPPGTESHREDMATAVASYELTVSDVFGSVSAVVPVTHRLAVEAHFFALPEMEPRVNVMQATISYQIPPGSVGFVAPGAGYYYGADHAAFSASLRWLVDARRVVSEGFLAQGFGAPDGTERAQIWDGNHVSLALLDRKLELGPTWEHINIREEDEWKWGARAAVRVRERVSLQLYVRAPGKTEWRAGFAIR